MKIYAFVLLSVFIPVLTLAKIVPPKPVVPIVHNGIEYSAPHNHMGCIYAKDVETKRVVWWKQVYVVKYNIHLERDVQYVFITSIKIDGIHLIVTNSRNKTYKLNINTFEVSITGLHENLLGAWLHWQGNTYFREGTKEFPPSRFRMKYTFNKNSCELLTLAANDAHGTKSVTWRVDSWGLVRIFHGKKLVEYLKVKSVTGNELSIQKIDISTPLKDLAKKDEMLNIVDSWLEEQKLNAYGDSQDTMYMGGNPLFDQTTGIRRDRLEYLLERFSHLKMMVRAKLVK
ncbi:hypothetical protein [Candidatus Uabimicrobium sp. HlEnr_7]|uniref:hypothetical protein n=1 Tax=Candidatus Uabimicrobium helgolandensis TaxID=3095367 RepID=UPI0035572049